MSRFANAPAATLVAMVFAGAAMFAPAPAAAKSDVDSATLKKVTADCRAQVKEKAKFEAMSLWARHKFVKKCIKETLESGSDKPGH